MTLDILQKTGGPKSYHNIRPPASSPIPILVVEPHACHCQGVGSPNGLAHVASSSITSIASPRLTHIVHLRGVVGDDGGPSQPYCVFFAPPSAILSTSQVGTRVDSCHSPQPRPVRARMVIYLHTYTLFPNKHFPNKHLRVWNPLDSPIFEGVK